MKLIILDRDGVINQDSDDYIKSAQEWIPIPGSAEAITRLNHAGYTVAVATNQSGLARNFFSVSDLNAMHDKMQKTVLKAGGKIEGIFYCPHGPNDGCDCRKPSPGLLLQIAERFSANLQDVYFVGDSLSDINAAKNAGAHPILVRTGKGRSTENKISSDDKIPVYDNLYSFVNQFLSNAG